MSIKIIKGDLLNSDANIICHQVNCKGIMGSGLAVQIKNKYPEVFEDYKEHIGKYIYSQENVGLLGSVNLSSIGPNRYIANIFGQWDYGRNNKIVYTNYAALRRAFEDLKDYAERHNYSISLPYKIGCGLANGSWSIVYNLIKKIFGNTNIKVTIYKL